MKAKFKLLLGIGLLLLIVINCASAAIISTQEKCITFEGEQYYLVSYHDVDGVNFNEYIKKTDSLDNWSSLITVKEYPKDKEISDIVNPYIAIRKPYMMMKPDIYASNKNPKDIIIILWLVDPNKQKIEYVLDRIVKEENMPAKSYVYSQHLPLKERQYVTDIMEKQNNRFKELFSLSVPVYKDVKSEQKT